MRQQRDEYKKRNIVITGGAGFIDSNFVRHWCENYPGDVVIIMPEI